MPKKLTAKQENFCVNVVTGNTRNKSYRMAYDADNMTDNAINVAAWELGRNPKIRERIEELEKEAARSINYTLEKHVSELNRLADAAEANGNYGAATQCRVSIGKACGLYTENISVREGELAPADLLRKIQTTDPATATLLAGTLGIDLDDPVKH